MSEFIVTIDNKKYTINTNHSNRVIVGKNECTLEISQLSEHTYNLKIDNNIFHITSSKLDTNKYSFLIDGHYFESEVRTKLEEEAANLLNKKNSDIGRRQIKSPMPGLILRINKNVGDTVQEGEPLILLEAMKMENEIRSPSSGKISEILIKEGKSVEKNQVILVIS